MFAKILFMVRWLGKINLNGYGGYYVLSFSKASEGETGLAPKGYRSMLCTWALTEIPGGIPK